MATKRNPNRKKAFEVYKEHSGDISLVEIASQLDTPDGTIRGWKSKDKWDQKLSGTERKKQRNVPEKKKNATEKKEPIAEEVKSVMENDNLTDKQRLFCLYYSRSFNATKSYQKAYECGYNTAWKNSSTLMANQGVREEITRLKEQRYARELLKPEDIFQKYMDIAFADITDYVKFNNHLSVVSNSKEVDGTILSEVKQGSEGISIKLNDRMKALQWLTDHMDMATEEQKARIDKLEADTKYTKEKTKLLQGEKKDLTHLEELFRVMRDD